MANDFMTNLITMLAQYQEKNPQNKKINSGIGSLMELIKKLQYYTDVNSGGKVPGLMPPNPDLKGVGLFQGKFNQPHLWNQAEKRDLPLLMQEMDRRR